MIKVIPLNDAAECADHHIIVLSDGIVLKEGYASRMLSKFRILKTIAAGELLRPTGNERHVIFSITKPPEHAELRLALIDPKASALPVIEVSPTSGKFMYRASQAVLALGVLYLIGGLLVGVALPTGLRWVSQYYGGGFMTIEERQKAKKVINDFEVMKENVIDQRAKDFFQAMRDARTAK